MKEDTISLICVILFFSFVGLLIFLQVKGFEDKNDLCVLQGYDKYLHSLSDGCLVCTNESQWSLEQRKFKPIGVKVCFEDEKVIK